MSNNSQYITNNPLYTSLIVINDEIICNNIGMLNRNILRYKHNLHGYIVIYDEYENKKLTYRRDHSC